MVEHAVVATKPNKKTTSLDEGNFVKRLMASWTLSKIQRETNILKLSTYDSADPERDAISRTVGLRPRESKRLLCPGTSSKNTTRLIGLDPRNAMLRRAKSFFVALFRGVAKRDFADSHTQRWAPTAKFAASPPPHLQFT